MAAGVVTPDAVVLDLETAGVASRLLGGLIDLLAQGAVVVALLTAVGFVGGASDGFGVVLAVVTVVGLFLVVLGYPVVFETLWQGRTPGKAAMGLRVVTVEGAPIRFRHAAIRSILGLIDKWTTQGVVGVLAILLTSRNQRLGDVVAGTVVLRERTGARPQHAVRFFPPAGLEAYTASLDVAALTNDDYQAVRSFLLRAPSLPLAVRADLAGRLAWQLVARLRADPSGLHPEAFLVCVAAAVQQRRAPLTQPAFASVWAGGPPGSAWPPSPGPAGAPVWPAPPAPPVPAGPDAAPGWSGGAGRAGWGADGTDRPPAAPTAGGFSAPG